MTGDPAVCLSCRGILSHCSKGSLKPVGEKTKRGQPYNWECEYCGRANSLVLHDEEIPRDSSDGLDYLISPAPAPEEGASGSSGGGGGGGGKGKGAGTNVVFCVDTSGSMAVSTEIKGPPRMTEAQRKEMQELLAFSSGSSQELPGSRRGYSHVSRLQFLQSAVDSDMARLARDAPETCVSLITFSDEVRVYGDGSGERIAIEGDRLGDRTFLAGVAARVPAAGPIAASRARLGTVVSNLNEGGQTALGPALVAAVAIAASKPGSQVIIATDGLANLGVGKLDCGEGDEVYRSIAEEARSKGVSVSIFAMKGENSRLEYLGLVADLTGGSVNSIDPSELTFADALGDPIIATNVSLELFLHRGLVLKDPRLGLARVVGNATAQSSQTFEFMENPAHAVDPSIKELPFQVQVNYTKLDGSVCRRVITKTMPVSTDKNLARAEANIGVIGIAAVQHSAHLAQRGSYAKAESVHRSHDRLMKKSIRAREAIGSAGSGAAPADKEEALRQYSHFQQVSAPLHQELKTTLAEEKRRNVRFSDSDSEGEAANEERTTQRRMARDDRFASTMYSVKNTKSRGFFS